MGLTDQRQWKKKNSEFQDQAIETTQTETQKRKKKKVEKLNRASVTLRQYQKSNKYAIGVPEKNKRQDGAQKYLKEQYPRIFKI